MRTHTFAVPAHAVTPCLSQRSQRMLSVHAKREPMLEKDFHASSLLPYGFTKGCIEQCSSNRRARLQNASDRVSKLPRVDFYEDRQRSQAGCAVESLPRRKEPQLTIPVVLLGSP